MAMVEPSITQAAPSIGRLTQVAVLFGGLLGPLLTPIVTESLRELVVAAARGPREGTGMIGGPRPVNGDPGPEIPQTMEVFWSSGVGLYI